MKLLSQFVVVAVVAGVGAGGWYFRDQLPFIAAKPAASTTASNAPPAIPVEIAKARTQDVASIVEAVGTTLSLESVQITAKTAGIIRRINFQEGQKVAAGAILIELDAGASEAKIEELRAARDSTQTALERSKQLLTAGTIAKAKVDELQKTYEVADARVKAELVNRADTVIKAPFAGRLGLRNYSLGHLLKPSDIVTTLDDTSTMKLEFEVPETALAAMVPGTRLAATAAAYPGRKFEGGITIVDGRVDPVTRAVRVRANLPNQDDMLKPGMFMTVQISAGVRQNAVMVPEEAILSQGGAQFVYVIRDGRAARSRVTLGQRLAGAVEIREGVPAGADVVVGGLQQIREGATVRIVTLPPAGQPTAQPSPVGTPAKS